MAKLFKLRSAKTGRDSIDYFGKVRLDVYEYRRVRLCSDKSTSERWLGDLQAAVDRKRADEPPKPERLKDIPSRLLESLDLIPSKMAVSRRKTWEQHVDDYVSELRTKGCNGIYADNARRYLKTLGKDCKWTRLRDADRDDFAKFIEARKDKGAAARTLNNIRLFAVSFLNWATKARRCDHNPLLATDKVDERGKRRRVRRSLTEKECITLLAAAGKRELCYRLALASGLRRRELALLQWRDIRTDGDDAQRPYLSLRPEATKSKRADEVPLSADIASRLRSARLVFSTPMTPVFKRGIVPTFEQWKADLKAAKIDYRDTQDRICGVHSLRVTLGTELERMGCPRAVRHWIMRHRDPSVSYQSYVDRTVLDAWEWINRLPTYPLAKPETMRKTGTADSGESVSTIGPKTGPNRGQKGGRLARHGTTPHVHCRRVPLP